MGNKNQQPNIFNWQSTNPQTGFLPANNPSGSIPSGVNSGTMSGTSTIYSNIVEVSRMDNHGFEVAWTGTPVGTITVFVSNSGINWPSLTLGTIQQPAGVAGYYGLSLNQVPFKYVMFQYTNSSGSGSLSIYGQLKDLN
jgi:hypothetical protein